MGQKLANFISTTLTGGIGPTDTTITVASSTGLPTLGGGDYFYGTIVSVDGLTIEIVKVTARAGAVLTATRGQDATSGNTFLAGAYFELRPVAQMIRDADYTLVVGIASGLAPLNASTKLATSYLETNVANGVPLLDGSGFIGDAQIPAAIARDSEISAAYATIASLSSYLTTAAAAATYATIASLSSYLTTAAAASTYETQAHATATFLPKTGGAVGPITINSGKLLSKITVSASAPGTLADGELYLKY
jgi:hypothetical protein